MRIFLFCIIFVRCVILKRTNHTLSAVSGFRRDVDEICAVLKMGPIRCPETSVSSYHTTLRNNP
jgi:hypothetical protein